MTSIEELFKSHNSAKRKFENPSEADPTQAYKSAKLHPNGDAKRPAQAAVADGEADDDEAGPSLPPDVADEPGDDEDGRFFGAGLEENAKDAMDFLDAQDGDEAVAEEKYDTAWLRRLALNFEKKVSKNATLRAKYEADPPKFMESEADLDDAIKGLSILSEHPELYDEFVSCGAATKLVELLAHDNTDIAICAIEIVSELTDEDVAGEQEQWDVLVAALLEADLLSLLVSNFSRFNESDTADVSGVYHSLSVIENLLSQPAHTDLVGQESKLLTWLLNRIQQREKPTSQNKQYTSEILSILTQSSRPNRNRVIEANGVEIFLTQLAPYRRDDPDKDSSDEEYMENLFNCLTSLVDEPPGKSKFLEAEGVELCLLMVRDGKTAKSRALKVLDHACGYAEEPPATDTNGTTTTTTTPPPAPPTNSAAAVCERLVSARGLKPLFSTFAKPAKHHHADAPASTEHILGIFASLLRSLPGNSAPRYRLLAKFLEADFQKIARLLALRRDYTARLASFDARLAERRAQALAAGREALEAWELDNVAERLSEGGLYCLEKVDVVLAWLVAEDEGARRAVQKGLADRDEGLQDVRSTLRAQLDGVLEVQRGEREMLEALVGFLDDGR